MNDLKPTDCFYYLISRVTLAMTATLKKNLNAAGVKNVKPAYLGVLLVLWKEDNLQTVELGRRAGLEPSSMTGLLDRMEKDQLIIRTPDPKDRRALRILLTSQARSLATKIVSLVTETLDEALQCVTEDELESSKQVLQRLLINLIK